MKISVIIPTFNRNGIVQKAINSVINQTYGADEIIVVDDGSRDGTREILKQYGDRIQYLYQDNAGCSAARNAGVQAATGEWIAFLDSDDEWLPEKLSVQVATLSRHPNLEAHVTNGEFVREGRQSVGIFQAQGVPELEADLVVLERPVCHVVKTAFFLQGWLVRRNALIEVGLFDTKFRVCGDLELMLRVANRNRPWGVCGQPLMRVFMRMGAPDNLTYVAITEPVFAARCRLKMYWRASRFKSLSKDESFLVRRRLSGSRLALGAAYLKSGNQRAAARCFAKAARDDPSAKVRVKAGLAQMFGLRGLTFVKLIETRGRRQFTR